MIKHVIKSCTYAANVNIFETHTALNFEIKCFRRVRVKNMLRRGLSLCSSPCFDITLHLQDFTVACGW